MRSLQLATWCGLISVIVPLTLSPPAGAIAEDSTGSPEVGENIALGAPYTLSPRPNYQHCTDPGDGVQLTDGESTENYFWTQEGTVGWRTVPFAMITVDLGSEQPISGVALTTAAGRAGVTWPMAIYVLTSNDGEHFREAGDLVALDHAQNGPWPEDYAIRRLVTHDLGTRGRYVRFVMIPPPGGPYMFVDEIEVFRGPAELLNQKLTGEVIDDAAVLYRRERIRGGVRHRFQADAKSLEQAIHDSPLTPEQQEDLLAQLESARRAFEQHAADWSPPLDFEAVLPLGSHHARLLEVQSAMWQSAGYDGLTTWVPATWDPVPLVTRPQKDVGTIEVDLLRGEYRAAALNLANATTETMELALALDGVPGAPQPTYVTVHEAQWTDTSQGEPVVSALPEAPREGDAWKISVVPGLIRQVWFTFHVTELPPGEYQGAVVLRAGQRIVHRVPLRLVVWPLEFPQRTTLLLGGWSYLDRAGTYGCTEENIDALTAHLREHYVNAPWARSGVMMDFEFAGNSSEEIRLDTTGFDRWLARFPDAKMYMVFLSVPESFAGEPIGSEGFRQRVGTWISAWVDHLATKRIAADRLGVLLRDEPHEGSDIRPIVEWSKAIKAAEPEVEIWEDPTYRAPWDAPAEMFEACDVLCPNRPMWLAAGDRFARFYLQQQAQGRELQFYSCSGPAKLLDPYSYYRLQAWHCRMIGGTGSYFWAFGDNSGASSWNEYLSKAGPYTPLFLDDHRVVPGKQMEAIRESVQDYEYFVMLEEAVARARRAGRNDEVLQRGQELLQSLAEEVVTAPGADELRWHVPKDRRLADRARITILRVLAELK